ncbi:Flp family type IVb pilin [Prosthecochloris sp. GSB1]|uniref:Flp family type IVb pilin n=1 Tax=Prosthecochloris sp. GSB1 TaxID=281093 RepID=UPI001F2EC8E4|nr:Flp family type IVb pilin [Prosthecochloris sp. GSB1]
MKNLFASLVAIAVFFFGADAGFGACYSSPAQTMQGKRGRINAQKGVTMIEYAVIAAMISIVAILLLTRGGQQVQAVFARIASMLVTAAGS